MVINTNLTGTGGTPLANSTERPAPKSKTATPSSNTPGAVTQAALNSEASQIFAGDGTDIEDSDGFGKSMQLVRNGILNNPATAMLAQGNLSPDSVLNLLQA
jgi:hypothetical protein